MEFVAPCEQITENIFKIPVPLPNTPLKETNAYFVRGHDRDLLIDTGFNHPMCMQAMRQAFTRLGIRPERLDLFITHMHADHSGLMRQVAGADSRIFMSEVDGDIAAGIDAQAFWARLHRFIELSGLAAIGFPTDIAAHPGFAMSPEPGATIARVQDGDLITVGDHRFTVVATPGHTAGHLCLHEPERGFLFSGDHILGRITPNITLSAPGHDVLADYLASLTRISAMDSMTVFPGHRQVIPDSRVRVVELQEHHRRRLDEVEHILAGGAANTVDVTRRMRWSLSYRNWDDYPPAQKLFSTGEAFSHLYHLVATGKARMVEEEPIRFQLD